MEPAITPTPQFQTTTGILAEYRTDFLRLFGQALFCALVVGYVVVEFGAFHSDAIISGAALLLAYMGLARIVTAWTHRDFHVWLFEDGLEYRHKGARHSLPWMQIETIWNDQYKHTVNFIPIININKMTIEDMEGREHKFSRHLRKFDQLSTQIIAGFVLEKFPDALRKLDQGSALNFGNYTLNKDGLRAKQVFFRWEELGGIQAWEGSVYIKKAGKNTGFNRLVNIQNALIITFFDRARIPNFDLMMSLIDACIERSRQSGTMDSHT